MTYFIEFHTPRGIFTSKPTDSEKVGALLTAFEKFKRDDFVGILQFPTATSTVYMTTEIIRQTVFVVREAE